MVSWACCAGTRYFCSALAALVRPIQNFIFFTVHYSNAFVPIAQQVGQTAMLGRLSLRVCLWLRLRNLAVRHSNHSARSHPQLCQIFIHTRLDLIHKLCSVWLCCAYLSMWSLCSPELNKSKKQGQGQSQGVHSTSHIIYVQRQKGNNKVKTKGNTVGKENWRWLYDKSSFPFSGWLVYRVYELTGELYGSSTFKHTQRPNPQSLTSDAFRFRIPLPETETKWLLRKKSLHRNYGCLTLVFVFVIFYILIHASACYILEPFKIIKSVYESPIMCMLKQVDRMRKP
jgi:hypothetical protein